MPGLRRQLRAATPAVKGAATLSDTTCLRVAPLKAEPPPDRLGGGASKARTMRVMFGVVRGFRLAAREAGLHRTVRSRRLPTSRWPARWRDESGSEPAPDREDLAAGPRAVGDESEQGAAPAGALGSTEPASADCPVAACDCRFGLDRTSTTIGAPEA